MNAFAKFRTIRRVLLIFPPFVDVKGVLQPMISPPLGIASLAAYIRDGVDVELLDCLAEAPRKRLPAGDGREVVGLSIDDIIEKIQLSKPDMVGISCIYSNQFAMVRELSRKIKAEVDSEMVVVTGGTHPSFLPEQTLAKTAVDYVVLGEGELGLDRLIRAHNGLDRLAEIDGLAFRKKTGICVHPRHTWIKDLDSLPFPARDLLPIEAYFKALTPMAYIWRKRRNMPIISSRGCPHRCPFCSSWRHWGGRFRMRSADNVLAEIEYLRDNYGVEELKWQDDNLTTNRERAEAIFKGMIRRGLAMPWNTPNGLALWTLDEQLMKLMKESGCYQITIAVESGDPVSFKKYVRKPFVLEDVRKVGRLARQNKISTVGYFIIGFPGETIGQIKNSMRFGLSLRLDYLVPFVFNPLPGSELWQKCLEEGYITEDYAYEKGNHYHQCELNTVSFSGRQLRFIQGKTYFQNLLALPLRNPREFAAWYGRQLIFHPSALRQFAENVVGLFGRGRRKLAKKTGGPGHSLKRRRYTGGM